MEDVATRNIYKSDIRYQIVKDKNGIPNKSYDIPVEISSTLEYDGKEYTWFRERKDASGSSRTTLNPREIRMVSQKLANDPTGREMGLCSVIKVPPGTGYQQEVMQTRS